jgi:hypothetical protein
MGYEYTPRPDPAVAAAKIKPPAVTLIVISSLGAVLQLGRLAFGLGRGMQIPTGLPPDAERLASLLSGPMLLVSVVFGLAVCGFIIFGALKMMSLQSYGVAMTAAIIASIPCISPCCCLDMIPGIWAIVVLAGADVKAAFR